MSVFEYEPIMRSVALLLFGIHLASGKHSLQSFHTLVSRLIDLPEYTVVGTVDDQQFMYFDSNTMKAEPKTEWIRQNEGAEYWDKQIQRVINHYLEYKNMMFIIMNLFNQSMSEDVHTFQTMYGCELEDDGSTQGYYEFGYDGEDFISLDKNTLTWTAANPQAVIIKNQWEANRAEAEYWKTYLENTCIESIKKYVTYGKNNLQRKVAPEVSLLQKNSSSSVICHATGFYPKNITMTWKKNNEDHYEDVEVSETLPNADGTFQKSISLSVKSEEWKKNPDDYRCGIQHVGTEKDIVVTLNENIIPCNADSGNFMTAVVVGCVLALTVLTITGITMCVKSAMVKSSNSKGYVKGSATHTDPKSVKPEQAENISLEHYVNF